MNRTSIQINDWSSKTARRKKKTKGRIIGFDKKICQSFLDIKLRFG